MHQAAMQQIAFLCRCLLFIRLFLWIPESSEDTYAPRIQRKEQGTT